MQWKRPIRTHAVFLQAPVFSVFCFVSNRIVRILSSSTRIQAASFVPPQYAEEENTVSRHSCWILKPACWHSWALITYWKPVLARNPLRAFSVNKQDVFLLVLSRNNKLLVCSFKSVSRAFKGYFQLNKAHKPSTIAFFR